MQKVRVPISSFQFGEVSDSLISRNDTPILNSSAQRVENFLVLPEGGLRKRHGLKHIHDYALTYDANTPYKSVLTSFIFDDNEEYVISIENQKLRAFRLLADGSVSLVATVTSDVNSAALPFDEDYSNQYTFAQYGDVLFVCHPLFAPRVVARTSLTTFEVSTFSFDQRADGNKIYQPYYSFQSQGVTLDPSAISGSNVDVEVNAQLTADLDGICLNQSPSGSGSIALTLNGALASGGSVSLPNAREISISDGGPGSGDLSGRTFTITGTDQDGVAQTEVVTGPQINLVSYSTKLFKTISEVRINATAFDIIVGVGEKTAVSYFDITGSKTGSDYLSSTHVGVTLIYHKSEMSVVNVQSSYQATVDIIDTLTARLSVLNPLRTREGSDIVEVTHINHGLNVGDEITIQNAAATGSINTGNLNVTDQVREIIDENSYTYQAGGDASSSEDGGGYVEVITHSPTTDWYEQVFSAVRGYPAAVCFHENRLVFGGTLAQPDTIWMSQIGKYFNFDVGDAGDTDSFDLTAATGQVNEIRYMISNRDLQVFTGSGELYIPTYLNQAITPTNAQIRKQTPFGTEFILPASIDGATIFVQHDGHTVREYLYTESEDAYTASAVSTLSGHLIQHPTFMTVVHSGFNLADSYAFLVLESGEGALFSSNRAEKRASWTRVTTPGMFSSTVAVHNRLFANVYDAAGNLHLCEFSEDVGLDLYLYKAVSTNTVDVSDLYNSGDVVDVIGIKDGKQSYLGELTVTAGEEVDLTLYSESAFTHAYVGKAFTAKIVSNPIDVTSGNGPVTGDVRGISNVILDLKGARSFKINNRSFSPDNAITGKKEIRVLGHSRDPQVTIEQKDPLPLQVNGLIAELVL